MNTLLVSRIISVWIFCIGTGISYNFFTTPYRIGPNTSFIILGVTIDTIQKYMMLCIYVITNIIIRNMNFNIISPWLIQNVQNTHPIQMPTAQIYQISVCFTLYGWIDSIIYINMILSQFDVIILEILTDVLINIYITRNYLINKDK
jgi:hypothetical protein